MKNILLIGLFSTTLFACVEVKFKNAQPVKTKKLTEFPQKLQGKYLMSVEDTLNKNDTIQIGINYFNEGALSQNSDHKNLEKQTKIYLSDSLVLKQVGKNFTINFKEKELWTVILLKPTKNGYTILMIHGDDEDAAEQMNLSTKVETIKDEDGKVDAYILDPKKKEFLNMIKNKHIFSKINELKRVNP